MIEHKLYIFSYDANPTFKHCLTKPLKFLIKLATWSRINHISHNYNYARCGKLINQAVGSGFESINYLEDFKHRDSTIYAHEIKVPIDFKRVHEYTKSLRGRQYDLKGAIYTKVHRALILRTVFNRDPNDMKEFCSEVPIEILKREGYLCNIENENTVHPKKLLKLLYKYGLCKPRFVVWKDGKLVNDIFNNV